jgi:hypothetical protein
MYPFAGVVYIAHLAPSSTKVEQKDWSPHIRAALTISLVQNPGQANHASSVHGSDGKPAPLTSRSL